MTASPHTVRDDEWAALQRAVHNYAWKCCHAIPETITIRFANGSLIRIPVQAIGRAEDASAPWASGPTPKHSPDYRAVYWPDLGEFTLSPKQSIVVRILWEAWESGECPSVPEADLIDAAEADSARVAHLFRRSPAWGVLVVPGVRPGTFRLPADDNGAG